MSRALKHHEPKADEPTAITPIEYGGLQEAFDHFNAALFDGELPDVFITYQRRAHSFGYFSPDRFSGRVDKFGKHELALNPDGFINQTDEQICQTLVHEMAHVWQHAFGKPSARGYHNKEWAAKMKAIGLQPSSTGMVGGKETGQTMSDYIIPDGPFTKAFAKLAATGWKLNLQSAHRPGPKGGTEQQDQVHLSGVRTERVGQAGYRDHLHALPIEAMATGLGEMSPDAIALLERFQLRSADVPAAVVADAAMSEPSSPLFESPRSYEPTSPPLYDASDPNCPYCEGTGLLPPRHRSSRSLSQVLPVRCRANHAQAWSSERIEEQAECSRSIVRNKKRKRIPKRKRWSSTRKQQPAQSGGRSGRNDRVSLVRRGVVED